MVEGSINLPWLNHRKHDSEIAEAKAKVSEQDAELAAMRNAAFGQIQEALAQVEGGQEAGGCLSRRPAAPGRGHPAFDGHCLRKRPHRLSQPARQPNDRG